MTKVLLLATLLPQAVWTDAPPLPRPVTNNAVAAVERADGSGTLFSFLGLDESRRWDGLVDWTFVLDVGSGRWREGAAVPGPGRLAATAQAVGGKVYLFGGYTVAEDGGERSLPNVDVYDPATDSWSSGAPIPVPVDDAVSGVWRDSLVYLVSGWHDTDNVADVQIYDPARDAWTAGTPVPGPPVFGHAGGLARDAIVYLDGVRTLASPEAGSRFRIEASAWRGDIDPTDPTSIRWSRLDPHPGPPLYRAAGGAVGTRVLFVGGTDNPYNYDGVGYDGRPSEPRSTAFTYDVVTGSWSAAPAPPLETMDHRGVVRAAGFVYLVGGMVAGQRVGRAVQRASVLSLLAR